MGSTLFLGVVAMPRCASFASPKLLLVTAVVIAATTQPSGAQRGDPPIYQDGQAHYDRKEQVFNRFTVVRNIEDYRAVPMLDAGPWLTKEVQLNWKDSTGTIGFSLVDNGHSVQLKTEGESTDGRTICITSPELVNHSSGPDTTDNWRKIESVLTRRLRSCSAITPAAISRAIAEMRRSGGDYAAAAIAWKSIAKELFGPSDRRCIRDRMEKPYTMPPRFRCIQYSMS